MNLIDLSNSYQADLSSLLFFGFWVAFALRTRLAYLNKRNQRTLENMSKEEKDSLDNLSSSEEISDNDPRYVFMT